MKVQETELLLVPECLEHAIKAKKNGAKIKYTKFPPSSANPKSFDQPTNVFLVLAAHKTWSYKIISDLPFSLRVILAVRSLCWNSERAYIELYKALIFKSGRSAEIVGIIWLFWQHVCSCGSSALGFQVLRVVSGDINSLFFFFFYFDRREFLAKAVFRLWRFKIIIIKKA